MKKFRLFIVDCEECNSKTMYNPPLYIIIERCCITLNAGTENQVELNAGNSGKQRQTDLTLSLLFHSPLMVRRQIL